MTSIDAERSVVYTPKIPELTKITDGKVRTIFDLGGGLLLLVASDRISARDVVLRPGIPGKGEVLNLMSTYFFLRTGKLAPNHFVYQTDGPQVVEKRLKDLKGEYPWLARRAMVVRAGEVLPIEFIFRVRATGSFYKAYEQAGGFEDGAVVLGHQCPPGMKEGHLFAEPIFTPSTKASLGEHDVNITEEEAVGHLMDKTGFAETKARELIEWGKVHGLALTRFGARYISDRGFWLADHKMEVVLVDGKPVIGDEIFTPDSSRFLDKAAFAQGRIVNYDKEPVRRWLDESWDGKGEPPQLPPEVVAATRDRYMEIKNRLV